MIVYRLHKYNPLFYDERGRYTRHDWTHVCEIGRSFDGKVLTRAEYIGVEDAYLDCISVLMRSAGVSALKVYMAEAGPRDVKGIQDRLFGMRLDEALVFEGGEWIEGNRLLNFCRLCLRDIQGYALSNDVDFFLCFTGDFYVHVGCRAVSDEVIRTVESKGLHLVRRGELGDSNLDNQFYRELIPRAVER